MLLQISSESFLFNLVKIPVFRMVYILLRKMLYIHGSDPFQALPCAASDFVVKKGKKKVLFEYQQYWKIGNTDFIK